MQRKSKAWLTTLLKLLVAGRDPLVGICCPNGLSLFPALPFVVLRLEVSSCGPITSLTLVMLFSSRCFHYDSELCNAPSTAAAACFVCCGALLCAPLLCILGVMWDSPLCPAAVCCQQLLALEPRMLCMRGPGGLGHTALHWAAAKDGAVCQGKVGRRLNHLMLHQGGGETGTVTIEVVSEEARTVKWLLSRGAPPGLRNAEGATPLHAAARNGRLAAADALLAACADRAFPQSPVTLIGHEIRNGKKQSPITVIGHEIRNGKGQSPATELSLQKYALLKANCLWTESSPGAVCFHAHAPALPCSRPARAHALLMPYLAHWQKADIKMFLILAKVGLDCGGGRLSCLGWWAFPLMLIPLLTEPLRWGAVLAVRGGLWRGGAVLAVRGGGWRWRHSREPGD
eukprot:444403-Pelagomonas_calceolata.AAC.1